MLTSVDEAFHRSVKELTNPRADRSCRPAPAHPLSASELIKKDKPDRQHCANVHAGLASDWMLLSSLTANPAPFSMAQKPPLALRVLGHVHCHRKGYLLMITLSFLPNEFPTASAPTLHATNTMDTTFPDKNLAMQDLLQRITLNPDILFGKPTIRNLRYPVTMILDLLAAGMTTDQILEDYEDLEQPDILACLLFASKLAEVKSIHKVAAA